MVCGYSCNHPIDLAVHNCRFLSDFSVFREGDAGDSFSIVLGGTVAVFGHRNKQKLARRRALQQGKSSQPSSAVKSSAAAEDVKQAPPSAEERVRLDRTLFDGPSAASAPAAAASSALTSLQLQMQSMQLHLNSLQQQSQQIEADNADSELALATTGNGLFGSSLEYGVAHLQSRSALRKAQRAATDASGGELVSSPQNELGHYICTLREGDSFGAQTLLGGAEGTAHFFFLNLNYVERSSTERFL